MSAQGAVPPERPVRRFRRRFVLALAVAAMLTFCCLGSAASFGIYTYVSYQSERNSAERALDSYLADLEAGNPSAAYSRLCTPARQKETALEFGRRMFGGPKLVNYHLGGVSLVTLNGEGNSRVYEVAADETYSNGQTVSRTYQVFVVRGGGSGVCPPR
jgi:hypothetical protein